MNMNEYKGIPGWFNFETVYDRAIREAPDGAHFVEVGSFLGASLAYLAEAVVRSGKKIKITAVDIWNEKFWDPEPRKNADQWLNGKSPFIVTANHLKRLGLLDRVNMIQGDSIEVAKLLHNDLFFVFLDSNHSYERVNAEIGTYLPKIIEGGILAGHDYIDPGSPGVHEAVDKWFSPTHEIMGESWWTRRSDDGLGTSENVLIPKTFHQIWLGEKIPERFVEWGKTWLKYNPQWQMKLWTEENLPRSKYDNILTKCSSLTQKSNILRYEILYSEGGFYLDTDFQCLKSVDRLISNLSAFTFAQDNNVMNLGAIASGAVGATARHPFIKSLLDDLVNRDPAVKGSMGPQMITDAIRHNPTMTVLPKKYAYPYLWNQPEKANANFTKEFPEAFAVHHWAGLLPIS